jgi:hypothetical protein
MIDQALCNIVLREREVIMARTTFQEAIISSAKEGNSHGFQIVHFKENQRRYHTKDLGTNIAEGRRIAKEVKESCEETFGLLNKKLLGLDKEG